MIRPTPDYQTPQRMAAKLAAVPLPVLAGKRVLDVGCDMGAWCWLAAQRGAAEVLGLDRGRQVKGRGFVDVVAENAAYAEAEGYSACRFERFEAGRQYRVFGNFDVVLCLSVYHHMYEAAGGDHKPIWFWLWQHARLANSQVIWEGPVDDSDPVVRANVSQVHRAGYTIEAILGAASSFFTAEYVGPALHEPTRQVWRFRPHKPAWKSHRGMMVDGAGGATKAFEYANGRRAFEFFRILGWAPIAGSLNVKLETPFGWEDGYYRAQVLDVVDRSQGFDSEWAPRWARFYPVTIDGEDAVAFRFEGDGYDPTFMELVAPWRLRDLVAGPTVVIARQ